MSEHDFQPVADWPPAIDVLNEEGGSDIVLICEHASRHIPASYDGLGLPPSELERHIAWDIGAEAVARGLSERLDAICFLGTYSRLVIDLNRPLDSPTSIPERSEDTDIPGNIAISRTERRMRAERLFLPFHARIAAHLDARARTGRPTRIVTIHSFTPVFQRYERPWHAGILFDASKEFGLQMIAGLRRDRQLVVDANVPYVIDRMSDYAIPVHGDARGLPAVLIEIRQDLISSADGVADWTERLVSVLLPSSEANSGDFG